MEKVIKEFEYTFECGQLLTHYNFKAIIKPCKSSKYRIKTKAVQIENGFVKGRTKSELYYKDSYDMIQEYTYQYQLCKKSEFTKSIKIIK